MIDAGIPLCHSANIVYLFVVSSSFKLSLISQSKLLTQYHLERVVSSNISDNFSGNTYVITELSPGT